MKYKVVVQRLAREDLASAHGWVARHAQDSADRWLLRFQQSIATLDDHPQRCPIARESTKAAFELRELLFGRKPNVFRVIFTIDGESVRVLRVRRAQRRFLSAKEIQDAADAEE